MIHHYADTNWDILVFMFWCRLHTLATCDVHGFCLSSILSIVKAGCWIQGSLAQDPKCAGYLSTEASHGRAVAEGTEGEECGWKVSGDL